jgi:hypothetical protein
MNGMPYSPSYIGALGEYPIYEYVNILDSNQSNFTITTSNVLNKKIDYTSNVLEYGSYSRDIILQNNIITLENNIKKLIKPVTETVQTNSILFPPIDITHTYVINSNILGEIRFQNLAKQADVLGFPPETPAYKVKIDIDGKLKLYWVYDPVINATWFSGWNDPLSMIVGLIADSVNQGVTLGGLQAEIGGVTAYINDVQYNIMVIVNGSIAKIETLEAQIQALSRPQLGNNTQSVTGQIESIGDFGNISVIAEEASVPALNSINASVLNATATNNVVRLAEIGTYISTTVTQNPAVSFALGYGFAGVGIAYGILQGANLHNMYIHLIQDKIANNSNLSTDKKGELLAINSNVFVTSNLIDMANNYYKLGLVQGFINSNTLSQQFINNLRVNNLDVNNGNITNINGITANELITSGKIKQNNILLDNTYLTSNHLYNLALNYSSERQYPSKLYTTSSPETTVLLLGKQVYKQILYLDNTLTAYGNGFYEIYSSSTYDNGITNKDKLFNFNTTETTNIPRWGISLYTSGTGNYQGNNSIDGSYYGDWIIIKLPQQIMLTRYKIYQSPQSPFQNKAPAEWKVYGSNDGITFTEITEASQMTRLTSYTFGFYEKSLNPSFTTQYQYIGFVFNKLLSVSGQTDLSFAELQIFGKEIISNSIVSNIYCTSNAVKNIVQYDMPIVAKHYGFYISITTPIVIGTTTFYKYDINLTPYCSKGIIQIGPQSGDTFRSFKIRVMLGTMYFSYIINDLPNVCFYEVFMSYKNTAAPPNGVAGLNACAIGYPHNPTLQTIMPNNLFVVKNGAGSIDYITVVATSPADVRCIIEDIIG